ncbi:MAG TPA: UDP-glucose 4-epimerase GalE [Arcobacter sp.]|jgi:UDP-glucose 4-epimerase|nr:UDP-glucose 4-epimerase GalE [Arcobacter sp.]
MPKILVTGGAGYIGSHTLVELYNAGYECIVYDNLSNASNESLKRVETIVKQTIPFIKGDIRDAKKLQSVFDTYSVDAVIHFAGLKAVGESVEKPIEYYNNNVNGTLVLLDVMKKNNCKKIVFSSSATVYGDPESTPIKENFPVGGTTNPYGTSKYMIERILEDIQISDNEFKIAILRYFNPVGAHESGTIGEDPNGIPNNLMPFISQVAVKKREYLSVFGSDYDTVDGTGVRDYIHVVDLSLGHVKALEYLSNPSINPLKVNLGTGNGYSVLQMVEAFQKANNIDIPYKLVHRRAGDIAICYASTEFAKETLGWEAKLTLEDMCRDTWKWQSNNPDGYNNG